MPTINVHPRYPERQNSVLNSCGAHHVKSLANKFTQLALQEEPPTRPKLCGYQNRKLNKPEQSSTDEIMSKRYRNSNISNVFKRPDLQTNDPSTKNERLNKKMPTMSVSRERFSIAESSVQLRRMHIKENDGGEKKTSVWSSSRSCAESYLGRSTNVTCDGTNLPTRKFSTLPLPRNKTNRSKLEKSNTKCVKSTANQRSALQSRDMNRMNEKQCSETNDNYLNETLSTSQKEINMLTESKMISENNANSNRLSLTNLTNNNGCDREDFRRMFYNRSNTNNIEINTHTQLMHPDWRKVPWKQYFGWTDEHQQLVNLLQHQVRSGELRSVYYESAEQHAAASSVAGLPLLPGPTVSTVREMLDVMGRAMDGWRVSYGSRTVRWRPPRTICYDADDED